MTLDGVARLRARVAWFRLTPMRRLEYVARGQLQYVDLPPIGLAEDTDALVRPVAATTCALDHAIIAGLTPFVGPFALGHEAVGEIVDVGDKVEGLTLGQPVVIPWHIFCGECGGRIPGPRDQEGARTPDVGSWRLTC